MKNFFLIILFSNISLLSAQVDWSRSNACEYKNFDNDYLIEQLIKAMTIEDKVGQVIQGDFGLCYSSRCKKIQTWISFEWRQYLTQWR